MERIMGPALGDMVRSIHESHGVIFHLGATVAAIAESSVTLSTGEQLDADLVVVGIGVRPAMALAQQAGLAVDRGVVVDEFLQTGQVTPDRRAMEWWWMSSCRPACRASTQPGTSHAGRIG